MLREFLKEVDATELTLRAGAIIAGQSMEYVTDPVADGETKVGVLEDPWVKALFLAYKARVDAAPREMEDLLKLSGTEIARLNNTFGALKELAWAELRIAMGNFTDAIELRAGWTVVRMKPETRRPHILVERIDLGGVFAQAMNELVNDDCGNPDCPIHGRARETTPVS